MVCISKPTMPRQIHPRSLIIPRNSQQFHLMKPIEQRRHGRRNPPAHHQYLNHLRRQQPPSATHQSPERPSTIVNLLHVLFLRKQSREENPPRSAPAVKLRRLQRIIVLYLRGKLIKPNQNPRRHKPTHNRGPRFHNGTARCNGSEPAKQAVTHVNHVPVASQ
ncbi:hypothetical protein GmHk_10G029493 [Glycine max]|nr:hypothetical protein GmHk_10G029493 [Glycine max]